MFTHSDKLLVAIQYFFLQLNTLLFLQTFFYFLKPARAVKNILYILLIFSPIPLYISNYVSADALFIGLSFLWLSQLLWIIYRPKPYHVFLQSILLLFIFTLRYNAIIYPFIAALAFLLSGKHWSYKISGIAMGVLLVTLSILFTSSKMEDVTGKRQFAAFGGWQLANNALYMYQHIPPSKRGPILPKFEKLEGSVRKHMDTLSKVKFTHEDSVDSYFYLWSAKGPLVDYMSKDWQNDSSTPYFKRWASEGPLYKDYALYLIKKYPIDFAKEFLFPNAMKFVLPPLEFIGIYNMGSDSVGKLPKEWFNYRSQKVSNQQKGTKIMVVQSYPIFNALINCMFILCCIGMIMFKIGKSNARVSKLLCLNIFFWLLNATFSIFASPVVLRYQIFPTIVICVFSMHAIWLLISNEDQTSRITN